MAKKIKLKKTQQPLENLKPSTMNQSMKISSGWTNCKLHPSKILLIYVRPSGILSLPRYMKADILISEPIIKYSRYFSARKLLPGEGRLGESGSGSGSLGTWFNESSHLRAHSHWAKVEAKVKKIQNKYQRKFSLFTSTFRSVWMDFNQSKCWTILKLWWHRAKTISINLEQ